MFELTIKLGDRLIQKYRGHSPISIGRDPGCEVMLDNLGVSRRHAQLREVEGRYLVEDMKSTNGVLVNGQRVSRSEVRPGDEIQIGKFAITFDVTAEEPAGGQFDSIDINQTIAMGDSAALAGLREAVEPKFAASVARSVFHKLDCNWIKATPEGYKVFFASPEEARQAGKRPCKTCLSDLRAL